MQPLGIGAEHVALFLWGQGVRTDLLHGGWEHVVVAGAEGGERNIVLLGLDEADGVVGEYTLASRSPWGISCSSGLASLRSTRLPSLMRRSNTVPLIGAFMDATQVQLGFGDGLIEIGDAAEMCFDICAQVASRFARLALAVA